MNSSGRSWDGGVWLLGVATFAPSALPAGTANVYYEAAAVIVTLILLGRTLEARAKGRTSEAIKPLVGLQPKTAHVQRAAAGIEIPIDDVRVGDVVLVLPAEKVPVDHDVVDGNAYVKMMEPAHCGGRATSQASAAGFANRIGTSLRRRPKADQRF